MGEKRQLIHRIRQMIRGKMGRFVRFKTKDIEKWVDERATNGRKRRKVDVRGLGV